MPGRIQSSESRSMGSQDGLRVRDIHVDRASYTPPARMEPVMRLRRMCFPLIVATLVASCATGASVMPTQNASPTAQEPAPSGSPTYDASIQPSVNVPASAASSAPASPPADPVATSAQPSPPVALEVGVRARTIVTTLRVRSKPNLTDDSIKYEPLLPKGTVFAVLADGPVTGSGYWWFEIVLDPGVLDDGITHGWLPAGDHDGTPWIENIGID